MSEALADPYHLFALYAAVNGLIMLILGVLVSRARIATKTLIGDGGKPEMSRAIRAHANNTEYTPMALLLMLACSAIGGSIWVIHGIGLPLTIGRLLHAAGLSRNEGTSAPRFLGMLLTWIAFIVGIVAVLWLVFVPSAVAS